jgi:hypothetical protein
MVVMTRPGDGAAGLALWAGFTSIATWMLGIGFIVALWFVFGGLSSFFSAAPSGRQRRVGVAGDLALLVGRHEVDTNAPSAPPCGGARILVS